MKLSFLPISSRQQQITIQNHPTADSHHPLDGDWDLHVRGNESLDRPGDDEPGHRAQQQIDRLARRLSESIAPAHEAGAQDRPPQHQTGTTCDKNDRQFDHTMPDDERPQFETDAVKSCQARQGADDQTVEEQDPQSH